MGDSCGHILLFKKNTPRNWSLLLSFIKITGKCTVYDVTINLMKVLSRNYYRFLIYGNSCLNKRYISITYDIFKNIS